MKRLFKILLFINFLLVGITAQQNYEALKAEAKRHIASSRFGEAIDLLNRYISINARNAEGYNLRGSCFEKREVFENAVLDYRRAVHLEPNNQKYQVDLQRALRIWHQKLYERIDGYKRELAINPKNAFNYLEIGKCYRWLEEWQDAETWYDEYLKRDNDASPDEIIRYTEILSHTGSLKKGEITLKKYLEKHPDDWRLWSRYGYFTMWLGNYENAKKAFNSALQYKPFFKEAQDGLDQAEKKGYMTKYTPRSFEKVYPIDRFYAELKKEPQKDATRFKLVYELMSEKRYEEAFQQLQVLQPRYADSLKFKEIYTKVESLRDSINQIKVEEFKGQIENNPDDKNAVIALSESYAKLFLFDEALQLLSNYVENHPEDSDEVRLMLARFSAWNYNWEESITQLDYLLAKDPQNKEYQLLRGQVAVWTVLELEKGEKLLLSVLEKEPENLNAIISLISLYSWQKNFETAKQYLELAKKIAPGTQEVQTAESNLEIHLSAYEEMQILKIREEAGIIASEGRCEEALTKYEEYFSKITGPTKDELLEYADVSVCAKRYDKALNTYDSLLVKAYDTDIAVRRAKVYYWQQDTLKALTEFERLVSEDPDNYDIKVFLGHTYLLSKRYDDARFMYDKILMDVKDSTIVEQVNQSKFAAMLSVADSYNEMKDYGDAELLYRELLKTTNDSTKIDLINQRLKWIPPYGASAVLDDIFKNVLPDYIALNPYGYYYTDNQKLQYNYLGSRLYIGLNQYLAVGGNFAQYLINSSSDNLGDKSRKINEIKANLLFIYEDLIRIEGSLGELRTKNFSRKMIWEGNLTLNIKKSFLINFGYKHTDFRIHLFSPNNINISKDLEDYLFNFEYKFKNIVKLSATYNYTKIYDGNYGNNFTFNIGRNFKPDLVVGYEFLFSDFARQDPFYYAPQNFESHSLWGDWIYSQTDILTLKLKAKIGYAPSVDFILRNISGEISYKIFDNLSLNVNIGLGSSYRYDSSYDFFSAYASLYFTL